MSTQPDHTSMGNYTVSKYQHKLSSKQAHCVS